MFDETSPEDLIDQLKPYARGAELRVSRVVVDYARGRVAEYSAAAFEDGLTCDMGGAMVAHVYCASSSASLIAQMRAQLERDPRPCVCSSCEAQRTGGEASP